MTEQSNLPTIIEPKDAKIAQKKYDKWCEAFLNKKSPTYGNATQSALAVYKTKKYYSAAVIGSQNLKKLKVTGLEFEEAEGRGVEAWFKILASKAMNGTYEQVADFMQRTGMIEKPLNGPATQLNQQFNFGNLAEAFVQARKERGLEVPQTQPRTDSSTGSSG